MSGFPLRLSFAVLAGTAGVLLADVPAIANEKVPEYAPTMLVLDASGSMADADPSGGTKMDAARRATRTFIDAVPDGAPVGLAVYGTNTGSSDAEKQAGCADVTVLRGPEPVDRAAITGAVDQLRPRGYTPIGKALRDAAGALPDSGPRSIVLVSDGIDTCAPPDPCEVAGELSADGTDLHVHAVGFGVDDKARAQLTCIAQTTGGTYTDAPDAGALEDVLPRVTNAALRNYQPAGIPVTGATTRGAAPELAPGQYLDVLPREQRRYYAVDVPASTTVYFTATLIYSRVDAPLVDLNRFEAKMYQADGTECLVSDASATNLASDGWVVTVSLVWDDTRHDACDEPGRYVFGVFRDEQRFQPAQLPLEILVGLEPAVTGDKGRPGTNEPVPFTQPSSAAQPVVGGGSFRTAATLDGSGVYTDGLRRGEFVFYRVRVAWGQAIAYRVRYGDAPFEGSASNYTWLYSPFRTSIDMTGGVYIGAAETLDPMATPPINYLNREEIGGKDVSVAGWYYIAVSLGRDSLDRDRDDVTIPVQLEVSITGDAQPGPSYDFASVEASEAGVFGEGDPKLARAEEKPAADPVAELSPFPAVWALSGAALVLVVLMVFVVRGRRQS